VVVPVLVGVDVVGVDVVRVDVVRVDVVRVDVVRVVVVGGAVEPVYGVVSTTVPAGGVTSTCLLGQLGRGTCRMPGEATRIAYGESACTAATSRSLASRSCFRRREKDAALFDLAAEARSRRRVASEVSAAAIGASTGR
jgi:hypothetical protein